MGFSTAVILWLIVCMGLGAWAITKDQKRLGQRLWIAGIYGSGAALVYATVFW